MVYALLSKYGIHHFYWSQIIHTTLQLFSGIVFRFRAGVYTIHMY